MELPCACIDVLDSDEDESVPERFSNLDVVMAIKQEVKFAIGRCGYILRTAKSGDQHSVRYAYAYMEHSVRNKIYILSFETPPH